MSDITTQTQPHDRAGRSAADLDAGAPQAGGPAPTSPAPTSPAATSPAATSPAATSPADGSPAGGATIDDALEALKDVVDPELGINIVDLGLVYDVVIDSSNTATIDMTLTSAACPLTDMIEDQVRAALTGDGLVDDFRINWVWMPPWDLTRITDDGRDQLRALGFSI